MTLNSQRLVSCNIHGQNLAGHQAGKAGGLLYLDEQVVIRVVLYEADMADSSGWVGSLLTLDACRQLLHACAERLSIPLLLSRLQDNNQALESDLPYMLQLWYYQCTAHCAKPHTRNDYRGASSRLDTEVPAGPHMSGSCEHRP